MRKENNLEKPLRIAMLGHKQIPSREGGIEIVVKELCKRMVKEGHHVTCYNRSGHHVSGKEFDVKKEKDFRGIRLKYVPTINKKGLAAITSSFFAALCCAFGRYDVVHFHAEGPCFWLWIPKLFGKRCIATVHGLDHRRAKWGRLAKWVIMQGERCAARRADAIIVLTKADQDYFSETYGRSTVLIPNGANISTKVEANEIKKAYDLGKDQYLLFFGRIVPEKGLRYLVEAFDALHTDKKLVIAGGASDTQDFMNELKALAAHNDRIIFTGFVEGDLRKELLSNAYLYVLPSDLEGMPLSLLEAMSYGNCCLTSDIAACTEVIEDQGITFPAGNTGALTEILQELCDHPETVARYKKDTAQFVTQKYSWDEVVKKTLALYGEKKQ